MTQTRDERDFCFGGYVVNMLAASIPDELNDGAPFHGSPAAKPPRSRVKAPRLLQFGSLKERGQL